MRRSAASLFAFAAIVGPVWADSADQDAQDVDSILWALLQSDIVIQVCELQPDQEQLIAETKEVVWLDFIRVLDQRAQSLNPELTDAARKERLLADLNRQINVQGSDFEPQTDCSKFSMQLSQRLRDVASDDLPARLQDYAAGPHEFDQQKPVAGWPDLQTYANAAQQERMLNDATSRLAAQGCDALELTAVNLSKRAKVDDTESVIYDPVPVEYQEEWHFDCNGKAQVLAMGFSDDGDGRVGPTSVARRPTP